MIWRLCDHYFAHGFDIKLFNILQDKFGHAAVESYLNKRQASSSEIFKAELSDINLLNDQACWNRFIADKEKILRNALDLLNFYHDWWLLGIGKEKNDPDAQIEETEIMDPSGYAILAEWKRFDALYPAISFALSYSNSI